MFFRKQKSAGNDNRAAPLEPTYIAADCSLDGNIETAGELHIEGMVRGTVRAGTCIIAAGGTVEGEVIAKEVIVHGRVAGPLRATHVHLQSGAVVEGDISSDTIAIDTGAKLSGAVWQANREEARSSSAFGETPPLFTSSLWPERPDDAFRPLKAVRPRAANGSRS